ncbi:MAG: YidC/Oxa1 family membrane protein insertase [Candidatus Saccharimonadales bacterium]|nr:YidC/Oxa1 family membrane protein insertase [Candidatus Saccharimonadales bacterium]
MFETLIVQPILNVLLIIYALVPGNDFGVAVILFTVLVRFALWPLLRKQLHQTRKIRELQPEIKKIKEKSKGDKQKEGQMLMELYKERGVSPFGSIGILFIQLPILIGLFQGLRRLANDASTVYDIAYDWVLDLGYMKEVVADISNFDESLLGAVDLTRSAFGELGTYMPALILAVLAAVFQFFQSKAMQPDTKDKRTLRDILKSEAAGKKVEQSEINAAMGRNMRYFFPAITFLFASRVPGALALYWATGSFIGILQQRTVLQQDVEEMEELVPNGDKKNKSKKDLTRKPKYPKKKNASKKSSAKSKGG